MRTRLDIVSILPIARGFPIRPFAITGCGRTGITNDPNISGIALKRIAGVRYFAPAATIARTSATMSGGIA
jgi:hypothetical protein